MAWLTILSRWVHVVSACVALGGFFFIRVVLPAGLGVLPPEQRDQALLKIRRVFKMVIHSAILLLLLSGTYNSIAAWGRYDLHPQLLHPLWGVHVLLGLAAFSIAIYLLAGRTPRPSHWKLVTLNLIVLLAAVAAASTLKWARESTVAASSSATP